MNKLYIAIITISTMSVIALTWLFATPTFAPDVPAMLNVVVTVAPNEYEMLVNSARTNDNLIPLTSSSNLRQSACNKAQDMIDRNYWSHNAPDGTEPWHFITEAGYNYTSAGENLARNFTTPESTVSGWMNSPTHKANIVGNYTDQGICTVQNITVQHLGRKE